AVLLDVQVGLRDVGLGLVVVVVGDEVLDGVAREELAELVAELRGERLVVRDHERRLARAGCAEERLVALAGAEALAERRDRRGLVARRPVRLGCLELRHGDTGYPPCRCCPKRPRSESRSLRTPPMPGSCPR